MSETTNTSVDTFNAMVALGAKAPHIMQTAGGEPVVCIPENQKLESLKRFYPPTRIERSVRLLEAGSFIDYVNRFKTAATLIFANMTETNVTFTAMLDYHAAAPELTPAFCSHKAVFDAIETPEWKAFAGADRKVFTQIEFATFIEDNLALFTAGTDNQFPAGAELLDLVKQLHGHKNARWERVWNPQTGAYSVNYAEEVEVKAALGDASGALEVPAQICAGAAMFQGGTVFEIPARLKTRTPDRGLSLSYEMINRPQVIRTSILQLVQQIGTGTSIVPLLGNA
jgi:uncharacterized protein YfdQ (DUF2303 family)